MPPIASNFILPFDLSTLQYDSGLVHVSRKKKRIILLSNKQGFRAYPQKGVCLLLSFPLMFFGKFFCSLPVTESMCDSSFIMSKSPFIFNPSRHNIIKNKLCRHFNIRKIHRFDGSVHTSQGYRHKAAGHPANRRKKYCLHLCMCVRRTRPAYNHSLSSAREQSFDVIFPDKIGENPICGPLPSFWHFSSSTPVLSPNPTSTAITFVGTEKVCSGQRAHTADFFKLTEKKSGVYGNFSRIFSFSAAASSAAIPARSSRDFAVILLFKRMSDDWLKDTLSPGLTRFFSPRLPKTDVNLNFIGRRELFLPQAHICRQLRKAALPQNTVTSAPESGRRSGPPNLSMCKAVVIHRGHYKMNLVDVGIDKNRVVLLPFKRPYTFPRAERSGEVPKDIRPQAAQPVRLTRCKVPIMFFSDP